MKEKTLIVYWTKTGINSEAAHTIAEVLETNYKMDVTVADLRDGQPDITPFKNIIVGGGVDNNSVYGEAVDFLGKNFENKNVALYFSCEDWETPKEQDTEENSRKVLAKNMSLKPIDAAGFGGCVIKQGKPVMDTPNVDKLKNWATELGEKLKALEPMPVVEVTPETEMPAMSKEKAGVFEVHCDAGEKWRFHLKAANGEIIAISQAYGSKEAAMKGIASVKRNAPIAEVKDLATAAT
jgi:uncharacterized protein YegP (UPF0339 family)/menaquinone-dependent protoporphyrinogen IX oxidase